MADDTIIITLKLTPEEAWALAQFCKRSGYGHFEECSTSKAETNTMIRAMGKLQLALRESGFAPR